MTNSYKECTGLERTYFLVANKIQWSPSLRPLSPKATTLYQMCQVSKNTIFIKFSNPKREHLSYNSNFFSTEDRKGGGGGTAIKKSRYQSYFSKFFNNFVGIFEFLIKGDNSAKNVLKTISWLYKKSTISIYGLFITHVQIFNTYFSR